MSLDLAVSAAAVVVTMSTLCNLYDEDMHRCCMFMFMFMFMLCQGNTSTDSIFQFLRRTHLCASCIALSSARHATIIDIRTRTHTYAIRYTKQIIQANSSLITSRVSHFHVIFVIFFSLLQRLDFKRKRR